LSFDVYITLVAEGFDSSCQQLTVVLLYDYFYVEKLHMNESDARGEDDLGRGEQK